MMTVHNDTAMQVDVCARHPEQLMLLFNHRGTDNKKPLRKLFDGSTVGPHSTPFGRRVLL